MVRRLIPLVVVALYVQVWWFHAVQPLVVR
jgi:hypothetical protein